MYRRAFVLRNRSAATIPLNCYVHHIVYETQLASCLSYARTLLEYVMFIL